MGANLLKFQKYLHIVISFALVSHCNYSLGSRETRSSVWKLCFRQKGSFIKSEGEITCTLAKNKFWVEENYSFTEENTAH